MSTKAANATAKPAPAVTNRGGRPRIHPDRTMTARERSARSRERKRQARLREQFERKAAEAERAPDGEVGPQEILKSLIASRRIVSHIDRLLAVRAVSALLQGRIAEGLKALDFLPPPTHFSDDGKRPTASDAKARVLQMLANLIAADDVSRRQRIELGEATEADLLRQRLAELERPTTVPAPVAD